MKLIIFVLVYFSLFACTIDSETNTNISQSNTNFDWLIGEWSRTNDANNKQTYERWVKISKYEYLGIGVTLENGDTVFKENLKIIKSANDWALEVRGVNEGVTPFNIISLSDKSFTSENRKNEFPKIIKYSLKNDTLCATISSDTVEVNFTFIKE